MVREQLNEVGTRSESEEMLAVRLQILGCFLAIICRRGVADTTRGLRVARPALSHRLVRLRRRLNISLFQHNGGGVALADRKLLLGEQTRRVLSLADEARLRLGRRGALVGNRVTVNKKRARSVHILTSFVGAFDARCPRIACGLCDTSTSSVGSQIGGKLLSVYLLARPISISGCSFVQVPRGRH